MAQAEFALLQAAADRAFRFLNRPAFARIVVNQAYAAKQFLEALVGPQGIQLGFYVEIAQPKRPLFKGPLEPGEGFVSFLQAHVNHRQVVW
jgi:hypothetical protein